MPDISGVRSYMLQGCKRFSELLLIVCTDNQYFFFGLFVFISKSINIHEKIKGELF